jgi:oxygen-independent coproporphyrinogen-3 oxidase
MSDYLPDSVYIHIPFCKSKCFYCGFFSKPANQYDVKKVLNAEIIELGKSSFNKPVRTLYIGGGSPASVGANLLCSFLAQVARLTGRADEFTIEINPADVNENLLTSLKTIGINRISIGAQSFIQSELDFLGRKYNVEKIEQTIKETKQAGFENIGLDLIFAIPNSNLKTWQQTLKKTIEMDVKHISAYSLTYEKNTPFEKNRIAGKIKAVDEELDREMYETAIETLGNAGFRHYEISNFAKAGFECKHNLTYWKNDYYLGIGPAAASYIRDERIENINNIDRYVECVEQNKDTVAEEIKINPTQRASQTAVLNLRLIEGIDLEKYKQKTGFDIYKLFGSSIEKNLKLKLLQLKNNRLNLTKQAMPIADSVLCDFAEPD